MLKITFEGADISEIREQLRDFIIDDSYRAAAPPVAPPPPKPKKPDVAERMAKARAARGKKPKPVENKAVDEPVDEPVQEPVENPVEEPVEEPVASPFEPEIFDMTKLAAIRVKTTEELQTAYANGKHTQVLALLSRYGNGAKSFRELALKDFVPIRAAIDAGALT